MATVADKINRIMQARGDLFAVLGIIFLTVAVYHPVTGFDFVNLDDDAYVFQNIELQQGLSAEGIAYALQTFDMANWMPVTWLSYMVDVELFGLGPGGFHLMNTFIHLVNALLLFSFLRVTTLQLWTSAFVAALFAIHPLHVESVAWISERKDVLSTLFWLLCLLAYKHYSRKPGFIGYGGVSVLFILGLAAKPMLVTLPLTFLLFDYWPLKRGPAIPPSTAGRSRVKPLAWKALLLEKAPLLLISLVFGIVTLIAQSSFSAVQSLEHLPFATRLANALVSYTGYLEKTVWPVGLAVYYPYPKHIPVLNTVISLFFLSIVTSAAVFLRRRYPYFIVGWLWYLVTLLPVIGIIQVGSQAMADRYTYVPLIGIFIIVAWGLPDLFGRWKALFRLIPLVSMAAILIFTYAAHKQVRHWQDSVTLFRHATKVTLDNYLAHSSLALGYAQQGNAAAAIEHYQTAIRLRPRDASLYLNLGNVYLQSARYDEAIDQYNLAHTFAPEESKILNNLAKALVQAERVPEALQQYRRALALDPDNPGLSSNFGAALVLDGQRQEAENVFRKILTHNPRHADAHHNLGHLYELTGNWHQAAKHYARALNANPDHRLAAMGQRRLAARSKPGK